MYGEQGKKLIELGFVSTDMENFSYDSFLTSTKIIVKNKYRPAPGLDPGKDIYKVTIIDNDEIIPEHSITKKYNL